MPVDQRFEVRPYRDGDERAILELFARSFPHAPRDVAHFDWKYRRSPFGNRRIVLTYGPEGLAGHYAGYPVPFRRGTRNLVAHQVGDTMTDPSARHVGRGSTSILGRTALEFYRRFCDGQVAFNYGFNVANIQKFSLRFLRSDRVEPVTYRVLDPSALPAFTQAMRVAQGLRLEVVRRTGPEFDEFFGRASHGYEMLVRRDAAYVQWRYLDCPDRAYTLVTVRKWRQLVGWIVYRTVGQRLILGDALVHGDFPEALDVALGHVCRVHGAQLVEAWFPPRPLWLSAHLDRMGFVRLAEPQDLSLMCVPFALQDATDVLRSSLYYTWGDSDLF